MKNTAGMIQPSRSVDPPVGELARVLDAVRLELLDQLRILDAGRRELFRLLRIVGDGLLQRPANHLIVDRDVGHLAVLQQPLELAVGDRPALRVMKYSWTRASSMRNASPYQNDDPGRWTVGPRRSPPRGLSRGLGGEGILQSIMR